MIIRKPYANIHKLGGRRFKAVIGGVPNVMNEDGKLTPLDNSLKIVTDHPQVKYMVRQNHIKIGFHKKSTNKYMSVVVLRTGETLVKTAVGDVASTPEVFDNRIIRWKYPNGSWTQEYVDERHIKEMLFQKAGQVIRFRYVLSGLNIKKNGNSFDIYRKNKKAFIIQNPYYLTGEEGDFDGYVPVTWQKQNGNWIVTYPAPGEDKYIA